MKEVIQSKIKDSGLFVLLDKIQTNDVLDVFVRIEQLNEDFLK